MTDNQLENDLKRHYGAAARKAAQGHTVVPTCGTDMATIGSGLYQPDELALLPDQAVAGSIGCANPVALAQLEPGEDVLDLGSGGGLDVLLSAERVGPTGQAYGLDMTPDMLELARANQARAGVSNAEFLEGHIEAIPLPDNAVDVVVSNCVINLSTDKTAVFTETHRVLRPGGRLAIADIVADQRPDPARAADNAEWAACIAGAVTRDRYRAQLETAGFTAIEVTDSHPVTDGFTSVFVRATKPAD
jgi:arsenite methyltransferase